MTNNQIIIYIVVAVVYGMACFMVGFRWGGQRMAKYMAKAMRLFAMKAGVPERRRRQLFMQVRSEIAGKR